MTPKPVAAGGTGPALPMDLEAGAAAGTGPAISPGKAGARKAGARRADKARAPSPGAAGAGGKLEKTLDKTLGKTKAPGSTSGSAPAAKGGSGTTAASGYGSAAQATGEWAFLQDKGISIEEKLFRYMMLLQKKADAELQQFMEATGPGAKGSPSSSKGTSLFDVAKAVVPALGLAESLIGEAGLKKLTTQLAGPVLAAAATAAGLPMLAPVALQLGGSLAQMAFADVGARAPSGSSGSAPAASEYSKMSDQQKALWLQHLMEKQKAMFSAVSNTLRAMHDTQMAAIHNIR